LFMKITYYLEVLSSWCNAAEPAWAELKARHGDRIDFQWKIALMGPGDFPGSREQCDWFYRRAEAVTRSPVKLNSGWFEPERKGVYVAYNLVAEAGRDFGFTDDRLRLALARAGHGEGRKIADMNEAVSVAAKAFGLDAAKLRARAESPEVLARVQASTAAFDAMKVGQRPTFVIEDAIGDKAIVAGLVAAEPLIALIEAMFSDETAYASYAAQHGKPPAA
jgi:predicted DsbA family dithiol-disulfide isomerase